MDQNNFNLSIIFYQHDFPGIMEDLHQKESDLKGAFIIGAAIVGVGMIDILMAAQKSESFREEFRAARDLALTEFRAARDLALTEAKETREHVISSAVRHVRKSCISRDKFGNMYDPSRAVWCEKTYRDYLIDALPVNEVALVAFLVYYGLSYFPKEPTASAGEWCYTPEISLMDLLQLVVKSHICSAFDIAKKYISSCF